MKMFSAFASLRRSEYTYTAWFVVKQWRIDQRVLQVDWV